MLIISADKSNASRVKRTHLGFEDFLEALCRVAVLKALPTDEELHAAGDDGAGHPFNAGTYLLELAASRPAEYVQMLRERATEWGAPPAQPMERCVEHLVHIMAVHCQGGLLRRGGDSFSLTQRQVRSGLAPRNDRE